MTVVTKEKDRRRVYERKGKWGEILTKARIGVLAFVAGVTLTLMFYPIIRP